MPSGREGLGAKVELGAVGPVKALVTLKNRVYFLTENSVYYYEEPTRWQRFKNWLTDLATPKKEE